MSRYARKVFLDGFLRNRDGFQLEIPLVPLGELYGTRLESWLHDQGVTVRLKTGVRTIEYDRGWLGLRCVRFDPANRSPRTSSFSLFPSIRCSAWFPSMCAAGFPLLASLDSLRASPITGVHLWFDRPVCPFDHVVTPGRLIQWVFNHTAIQGRGVPASDSIPPHAIALSRAVPPCGEGQYLQLVISALIRPAGLWTRSRFGMQSSRSWPRSGRLSKRANLLRSWVVIEHGATFSVSPGVDALRPPQQTPVDGLLLAGDWTSTSWPATMEGAVRSGYLAAEVILRALDRPTRLVRPELKTGLLARWLFGAAGPSSPSPRVAATLSRPASADFDPSPPEAQIRINTKSAVHLRQDS